MHEQALANCSNLICLQLVSDHNSVDVFSSCEGPQTRQEAELMVELPVALARAQYLAGKLDRAPFCRS